MKKRLLGGVTRWILVTMVLMLVAAGAAYAYTALTGSGTVKVKEPLSWVGANTFSMELYPQETNKVELTLANASSLDLKADIASSVTPVSPDVKVTIPNDINVPANDKTSFIIEVTVTKSAAPGTYTVNFAINR